MYWLPAKPPVQDSASVCGHVLAACETSGPPCRQAACMGYSGQSAKTPPGLRCEIVSRDEDPRAVTPEGDGLEPRAAP